MIGGAGNDSTYGGFYPEESGDDLLIGGAGDDQLDGGPGYDRADGADGTDACINGEIVVGCELDVLPAPLAALTGA